MWTPHTRHATKTFNGWVAWTRFHTEWMRYHFKITQTCEFKFEFTYFMPQKYHSIASVGLCCLKMCKFYRVCGISYIEGNKEINFIMKFYYLIHVEGRKSSEVLRKPEIVETLEENLPLLLFSFLTPPSITFLSPSHQ